MSDDEDVILNEDNSSDTIEEDGIAGVGNDSAEHSSSEDALKESQRQINELLAANKSLQDQIGQLLRSGVAINDAENAEENDNEREPYISLNDLGNSIGKRDYHITNGRK